MRSQAVILALLLAAPSPALAQLRDGFSWDSGPGRHNPSSPSHPSGAAASRSVAGLDLGRTIQDGRDHVRAHQELKRIERRRRSLRERFTRELAVAAWLQRQELRLDSADRQLDLDAARLALAATELATLRLEREISRGRQRVDLRRAAGRVKVGRRRVGPRF